MAWWLGVGAGVGVMGAHAALRVFVHALSREHVEQAGSSSFLLIELGGLGGGMLLVLGGVALVLAFVPVHTLAFVGTVLSLLVLSMVVEVGLVVRRLNRGESAS